MLERLLVDGLLPAGGNVNSKAMAETAAVESAALLLELVVAVAPLQLLLLLLLLLLRQELRTPFNSGSAC
jgi:hypothetical protein